MFDRIYHNLKDYLTSLLGAIIFYPIIPLPEHWPKSFQAIARWSPLIGLSIGALLAIIDILLDWIGFPITVRSALIIALGIYLTGGLHLDGVMDSADGLAVTDKEKRLEVMQDSVTGAFGVMAGVMIIVLKVVALSAIIDHRGWSLMVAYGWGRWGQLMAIALYPYLREQGKGAFHKKNIRLPQDILVGSIPLLFCSGFMFYLNLEFWVQCLMMLVGCAVIALATGYYFYYQLKGHTGDTYGAIVEWSEALILCLFTGLCP